MATEADQDEVKVWAPDYGLARKAGGVPLSGVFSSSAVAAVEETLREAKDGFAEEGLRVAEDLAHLEAALHKPYADAAALLRTIGIVSFQLKNCAGFSGYDLVAELARSLHLLCEFRFKTPLNEKDLDIIQWHTASLLILLRGGLKGEGGPTGTAIVMQLRDLWPEEMLRMRPGEKEKG